MITWTITEGVEHTEAPGALWWTVNGEGADANSPHQDKYDERYYPDLHACLHFLVGSKMKIGDTVRVSGADTGRILRIRLVKIGQKYEYDVGSRQLANPEELIGWLAMQLQSGDTVAYLGDELSQNGAVATA